VTMECSPPFEDSEGYDEARYWIGDIRLLQWHLNDDVPDSVLDKFITAARAREQVEVEIAHWHHGGRLDFAVMVWALRASGLERLLVWGTPSFRTYDEAAAVKRELDALVRAVDEHQAAYARASQCTCRVAKDATIDARHINTKHRKENQPMAETGIQINASVGTTGSRDDAAYENGEAWRRKLASLEAIIDLVKAGHRLELEMDGQASEGYSLLIRDVTAEWKELPRATGYESVPWGTRCFYNADEADEVFDVVRRILAKLQELRDTAPSRPVADAKRERTALPGFEGAAEPPTE
jgi:hypothetical protein